jgi:hypothetical protein
MSAVSQDQITAVVRSDLPQAPLAMPKQVLEMGRGGVIGSLLARLIARPAGTEN